VARIIIALGSNLADPPANVSLGWQRVVEALELQAPRLSRIHISTAAEQADGPDFANAVGLGDTSVAPRQVLACLHRIERRFGRDRGREGKHGNRPLDLDLIDYDGQRMDSPELMLPHPALSRRDFVLAPLLEVAPEFVDARSGQPAKRLLQDVDNNHLVGIQSPG
jgi:2-amino-4-hydroxy-6-hydroxymethyldihydropteridine diphosphokinase